MTSPACIRAACVLVMDGDKILAVEAFQRPGELSLPGGHIDPGETPYQAAQREVFEEAGLAVDLYQDPIFTGPPGRGRIWVSTFQARSFRGTPRPGSDALRVCWIVPEQLLAPRNRYASYNREALARRRSLGERGPCPTFCPGLRPEEA